MRGFHELLVEWAWIPLDLDLDMNCFYFLLEAAGHTGGGWGDHLCGYGRWERGED